MSSEYKLLSQLTGPRDAVLSLAFSAKAKFLAAAGYSGVYIWDLSTSSSAPLPHMLFAPQNPKYVITASVWTYFQKTNRHILILGSMRGDILLWDWSEEAKRFNLLYRVHPMNDMQDEILSLDVHEQTVASGRIGRVVASTANRCISVWTLSSAGEFNKVFSTTLGHNLKPKTVRMCKITRDVFVFPLYGGEILRLDYKTGAIKSRRSPGPGRMGSVALNHTADKFVTYTGKNFQLYRLGNLEILKNFTAEAPVVSFPKQVAFGELETIVVGGTDRGCALVYNIESEEVVQRLSYPGGSLVQPVSTFTLPGCHLIAIAGSTQEQPSSVILFEKHIPEALQQTAPPHVVGDLRNKSTPPNISVPNSIHIGFYLPKIVIKLASIIGAVVFMFFALYYTMPKSLQVCALLDGF
ncbi:WD40-repeat-containing domain protein [Lentinula boryana]|uniref:WD40-repeat-containing domain protein n=1 Tax=Lentinula boryana TaxID=40481 RepID=A0ABQ8Q2E0_9AGAR|nr:WD40-repeat-containing domain protein [Lentinula aff. detonsa]KAJ3992565.1 WD40-repeat-containing domain protein [Lentinula boryana]